MSEFEIDCAKLLSDKRVIDEINRHLWIESERAGYDIGFEKAKEDWLKRFAVDWMEYHMPEEIARLKKNATSKIISQRISSAAQEAVKKIKEIGETAVAKRRRAKSYF